MSLTLRACAARQIPELLTLDLPSAAPTASPSQPSPSPTLRSPA